MLPNLDEWIYSSILVEPEIKGSQQLYKEIYIIIHTQARIQGGGVGGGAHAPLSSTEYR